MVGGAGGLSVAGLDLKVIDQSRYPRGCVPIAQAHIDARGPEDLAHRLDHALSFAPGERRGVFQVGAEELLFDGAGASHISMEDFVIAVADELETPQYSRQRYTVGY